MRSLITGIEGFAGRHLAAHLVAQGDEVVGSISRSHSPRWKGPDGVRAVRPCDVESARDVLALVRRCRPDRVFHLAGISYVPDAASDPARALSVNTQGAVHVAMALLAAAPRARLLLVSSSMVYGARGARGSLCEDVPPAPDSVYGVSKLAAELMLGALHHDRGLDVVIVRAFNHTGPGQRLEFAIPAFARRIATLERGRGRPILPAGNLSVRRDLTDVRDMVRAYRLALERGVPGATYNVGSGEGHTIGDLLERLLRGARRPLHVEVDPRLVREGEAARIVCDARRFHARTGWAPRIPIERTLADVLDDVRRRLAHDGRGAPPPGRLARTRAVHESQRSHPQRGSTAAAAMIEARRKD